MKLTHLATLTALLVTAAAPARADRVDELLLRLKEKGILTSEDYDAIRSRQAANEGSTAGVTTGGNKAPQDAAAAALDDKRFAGETDKRGVRMTESGVGFEMGGVTLKFSGSVNGFYTHDSGDRPGPGRVVVGGLATVGSQDTSSIRNGLLPGFLKIDISTNQGGWDVGAHFGLYPGINSVTNVGGANSAGSPSALGTSGIDARQTYLTFGRAKFGEVKIGRDIGLFASDAILNDITLLGVGTASGNAAPSNTSLGRIGLGYIYTDFQPQITYSTPKMHGLQIAAGVFQPLVTAGIGELNGTPGFQGKVTYDFGKKLTTHLWAGGIVQHHDSYVGLPSYDGAAFDVGAKLGYSGLGLVGYYYNGSGVGTTGLFILSTDALGRKRDSSGFYVQGTYTIKKVTIGGSYGESSLDLADGEINPTLLSTNSSYVGQLRYGLTAWVNLVGEYTHTRAEAQGGNHAESDAVAAGGILFF